MELLVKYQMEVFCRNYLEYTRKVWLELGTWTSWDHRWYLEPQVGTTV